MFHRIPHRLLHHLPARVIAAAAMLVSMAHPASSMSEADSRVRRHPIGPTGSRSEAANYTAEISAPGGYKAGAEGSVQVTLTAKGEYHINPQYPYKFKAATPAPEGITYPKPILQRADGKFEETRGTFALPFVAAKAGKAAVGGILQLSVCSANNCVMDKVALEVVVDVK